MPMHRYYRHHVKATLETDSGSKTGRWDSFWDLEVHSSISLVKKKVYSLFT